MCAGTVLVAALALAGCSSDPGPDDGQSPSPSGASPTQSPDSTLEPSPGESTSAAPVVRTVSIGTRQIEFSVGPLVRMDSLSVLRIEARDTSDSPEGKPVRLGSLWKGLYPGASGVRLLDPEALTIEETASVKQPIYTRGILEITNEEPTDMYVVFGKQNAEETNVMLPFGGVFTQVPIVDEDEFTPQARSAFDDLVPDPTAVTANVADLGSFSVSLNDELDTRNTGEEVVVNLTADVLFSFGKSDLSAKAQKSLEAAAKKFHGYSGGTLTIVGHTDDQGGKDFNQKLSEQRAQAVADRLADLGDLDRFDVAVEGKGLTQPRAEGKSEQARALNRRVELVLKPDGEVEAPTRSEEATTELPKGRGPSATGHEGVVIRGRNDAEIRVRLAEVTRLGQTLVGQVHVEHVSGDVSAVGPWFAVGVEGIRGGFQPDQQYTPANLTLVVGDERFYPLDYRRDDDKEGSLPLTELTASESLPEGGEFVLTAVWPDVVGDTATDVLLDVETRGDEEAYRKIRPPFRLDKIAIK